MSTNCGNFKETQNSMSINAIHNKFNHIQCERHKEIWIIDNGHTNHRPFVVVVFIKNLTIATLNQILVHNHTKTQES